MLCVASNPNWSQQAEFAKMMGIIMNGKTNKSFAEFFAGIGLMRIGLERAGWRIAFANDIDEDKWRSRQRLSLQTLWN